MATMRCPNCSSEIKKPTNVVAILLGIFAFLFVGGAMFIVICLAAVAAIGSASAEFDEVSATIQAESIDEIGIQNPTPAATIASEPGV